MASPVGYVWVAVHHKPGRASGVYDKGENRMKYLFQFGRMLAFCLAGELLHTLLPLPIPASVYGLALLLAALVTGLVRLDQVRETALFLTGIFPLLFVPAAAGVMDLLPEISAMLLPILLAVGPVTVLVMAVAGRVTQALARKGGNRDAE